MAGYQIFVTGDYWHSDFQMVLNGLRWPATMVPLENLYDFEFADFPYSLFVIAQSRRSLASQNHVEFIRSRFSNVPIVALKGSLCEGELRSGNPLNGVIPLYWHQWEGRFQAFAEQLAEHGLSDWHLPPTATPADRAKYRQANSSKSSLCVGVSAWTQENFDYLRDACRGIAATSFWVERTRWDQNSIASMDVLCVDANSVTDDLWHRIQWLRNSFPTKPIVLILNFPRVDEVNNAIRSGVTSVISKPFELDGFAKTLRQAVSASNDETITERY